MHGNRRKNRWTLLSAETGLDETEIKQKDALAAFLDRASEDQITELLLMPLFLQLGFERVSVTGHKDKRLEFGTDLWMKFTLPTHHALSSAAKSRKAKSTPRRRAMQT